MRALLALLLMLFAAPVAAQRVDWNKTITLTPEGGYLIGNPKAKVRVIEFFSLTCPHCKDFVVNDLPVIRSTYITRGTVSLELRNFVLNGPDLAASMLMRCASAPQAVTLYHAAFAEQHALFFERPQLPPAALERVQKAPVERRALQFATEAGLLKWFVGRGVPVARANACLTDKKAEAQLIGIRKQAISQFDIQGTPGFVVNGKKVQGSSWLELEPVIQQALRAQN